MEMQKLYLLVPLAPLFGAMIAGLFCRVIPRWVAHSATIAGVAVAITLGGAGAVFWMWVIALVGMATSFFECSLAQLYKEKDGLDSCVYRGGPAYYATKGLGQRWLGIVISILILITFGLAFNATQSFVISTSFEASFNLPTWVSGIILSIVFGITIFGGVRGIVKMSEVIVPIMALGYLLIALVVNV